MISGVAFYSKRSPLTFPKSNYRYHSLIFNSYFCLIDFPSCFLIWRKFATNIETKLPPRKFFTSIIYLRSKD